MAKHAKTLRILDIAGEVLAEQHPMTVRQVYYQLVSRQVIENNRGQYQAVSNALVDARKDGTIPWSWLEDRLRRPRHVLMWRSLTERIEVAINGYRRDVWPFQPRYLEVWLEKDALSGIFEDTLRPYGVTLNVGRGYDGWDSIHKAAERYQRYVPWTGAEDDPAQLEVPDELIPTTILYFGDFDPSGEDMVRLLGERLRFFGVDPVITKCALTADDVTRYQLPPDFTKATDTRRTAFVAKHGDIAVELDALPVDVLRARHNKVRQLRAALRRREVLKLLGEIGWSHGSQAAFARRLRVSAATISRDMAILLPLVEECLTCHQFRLRCW